MRRALALAALLVGACDAWVATDTPEWVKPETVTVSCEAWAEVPDGNAVYFNNVWNEQAAGDFAWQQCIERDPANPSRLGFSWNWPDESDTIYSQPQVKIGSSPWKPAPHLDLRFPRRMSEVAAMDVATGVTVDAQADYNIVNTLWLTDTGEIGAEARPESIVAEVMIWTYRTEGLVDPAGSRVGTVEQGGQTWDIWLDEDWHDVSGVNDNRWIYVAFVARDNALSAAFDPVALLRSDALSGLGLEDAWIADVELGAEVMRGEGLMWIDRFDVSMEPK